MPLLLGVIQNMARNHVVKASLVCYMTLPDTGGALVATALALPALEAFVRGTRTSALTASTNKAIRPARLDNGGFALRFIAFMTQKLSQ